MKKFTVFPTSVGMNREHVYSPVIKAGVPHIRGDEPTRKLQKTME